MAELTQEDAERICRELGLFLLYMDGQEVHLAPGDALLRDEAPMYVLSPEMLAALVPDRPPACEGTGRMRPVDRLPSPDALCRLAKGMAVDSIGDRELRRAVEVICDRAIGDQLEKLLDRAWRQGRRPDQPPSLAALRRLWRGLTMYALDHSLEGAGAALAQACIAPDDGVVREAWTLGADGDDEWLARAWALGAEGEGGG